MFNQPIERALFVFLKSSYSDKIIAGRALEFDEKINRNLHQLHDRRQQVALCWEAASSNIMGEIENSKFLTKTYPLNLCPKAIEMTKMIPVLQQQGTITRCVQNLLNAFDKVKLVQKLSHRIQHGFSLSVFPKHCTKTQWQTVIITCLHSSELERFISHFTCTLWTRTGKKQQTKTWLPLIRISLNETTKSTT